MKRASPRSQLLTLPRGPAAQSDPACMADALDRVELLVPEAAYRGRRDALAYALAYVEHYQGDVLQLEQEWAFLAAALTQTWQRDQYALVVRLAAALALPAGRRPNLAEAEWMLRLGVEASRRTQDRLCLAALLNRLSGLLFARANFQEGWRLWQISLRLGGASASPLGLWEPLSSFAYIADAYLTAMFGSYPAPQFVETMRFACQGDHFESAVVALFVRGFYARLINDLDNAYEDLSCALRLLTLQSSGALSPARQLFMLVIQAELARAQGAYARSQAYTETALALAQTFSDRYTVAALLIDQGLFILRQEQHADMQATHLRLRDIALQMESPRAYRYSRFFEHHLAEPSSAPLVAPPVSQTPLLHAPTGGVFHASLSGRELEVLQLVAAGLPNQQIARLLVVTPGTVKKHLEHIYTRLGVHSRTAALARARLLNLLP